MKTTKKFPLTTFIKNVQSTTKKVEGFAINNIEYFLIGIGIVAKVCEAYVSDFNMPLSFYTDTAIDVLIMCGWIRYPLANLRILRRRVATCALNFECLWLKLSSSI